MKIHSLTLEGFGPFKSRQTIDFDCLASDKLFMLEGPTGAGKSSIIDAIVFALYGDTAQQGAGKAANAARAKSETDRMSQHRIRSDYCGIDDPTEVILEFSNSNGRYRIRRVPALPRLKRDGSEDLSNPKAELSFIKPEALPVTGPREVNLRVKEIVGLDEKQFNQLIVLPQGKFTTFLFADRNSRELILTEIFRTFFFDKLTAELSDRKKKHEEEIKNLDAELSHHVRNLQTLDVKDSGKDWALLLTTLKNPSEVRSAQDFLIKGLTADMYVDSETSLEELGQATTLESELIDLISKLKNDKDLISEFDQLKRDYIKLLEDEDKIKAIQVEFEQVSKLEPLLEIAESFEEAEKELRGLEKSIPAEFKTSTEKQLKTKLESLEAKLLKLEKELSKDESLDEQIEALEDRISDGEEIEEAQDDLVSAQKRIATLEKSFEKKKAAYESYVKQRKSAGAAVFAKGLKSGQPCPVCGSKEHPAKAKSDSYDEDVEIQLEQERDAAKELLAEFKSEIKSLSVVAKRKLPDLKDLRAKLADLEKRSNEYSNKLKESKNLTKQIAAMKDALDKILVFEGQKKISENTFKQLAPHLEKNDLTSVAQLKKLAAKGSESLKMRIDDYLNNKLRLESLMAQDQFKNLKSYEVVDNDLQNNQAKLLTVRKTISDITSKQATAKKVNSAIGSAVDGLSVTLDSLKELSSQGQSLLDLESVVRGSGRNRLDLKLQRYVLQEKLELVLERASGILYQISGGKYEFKLQEEKIKGQLGKSGLGITVLDLYAGKERPAETLSGGEAFYSSLALALGLAEVIRADRGGLELGTLFIDEGFGSLDEDKRDEVLTAIENLGASNRIIGIISHVESMKSRIPARLEVRSTKEGPSIVRMVGV